MQNTTKVVYRSGISLMSILAALMSWTVNKSVIWALIHFFCGIFYVLYACCAHTEELNAAATKLLEP